MTLSLTKPGGWGANTKFRSTEATDLDAKTAKALDRTVAGDTLLGVVTLASGAGLSLSSGSSISLASGSSMSLAGGSSLSVASGSSITMASGSTFLIGGGERVTLVPRARAIPFQHHAVSFVSSGSPSWLWGGSLWVQSVAFSAFDGLYWPLPAKPGMTSVSVSIDLIGAAGHASLPASMPRLHVERVGVTSVGVASVVSTVTDTSANVAAYQALHTLTCPTVASIDVFNYRYFVVLYGEFGAGSSTQLTCCPYPYGQATYSVVAEEF